MPCLYGLLHRKNAILNAVSWYDASAEKVIKGTTKLTGEKLERLLENLDCQESQLPDYGYFPTAKKANTWSMKPKATCAIPRMCR